MKSLFKTGVMGLFLSILPACIIQEQGVYLGQTDTCNCVVAPISGKGARWSKTDFPLTFYIHSSVPLPARKNFISAIGHWNMAWEDYLNDQGLDPFSLFAVADKRMKYSGSPGRDSYNLLIFITENYSNYVKKTDEDTVTQAITSTSADPYTGKITDTDIIVNAEEVPFFYDASYDNEIVVSQRERPSGRFLASSFSATGGFWFSLKQSLKRWFRFLVQPFQKKKPKRQIASPSKRVPRNKTDFPSLMVHELGHVPCLGHHEDEPSRLKGRGQRHKKRIYSIMRPKLLFGQSRRAIGKHDLDNLFCAYFGY